MPRGQPDLDNSSQRLSSQILNGVKLTGKANQRGRHCKNSSPGVSEGLGANHGLNLSALWANCHKRGRCSLWEATALQFPAFETESQSRVQAGLETHDFPGLPSAEIPGANHSVPLRYGVFTAHIT